MSEPTPVPEPLAPTPESGADAADDLPGGAPTGESKLAQRLHSLPVIVLALFLFMTVRESCHYLMELGEIETMMYAKQFAEPDYLPGDWYLNLEQGVRRPYQLFVRPLVTNLSLPWAAFCARLAGYLAVAVGLGLVLRRLGMNALDAVVVYAAFCWIGQSVTPNEEWITQRAESKTVAYAFLLLGVHALMAKRTPLAAFWGGLATTLHVLVGFWGTVALYLAATAHDGRQPRVLLASGLLWAAAASPALYYTGQYFLADDGREVPADFDAAALSVEFRNPHNNDPTFGWRISSTDILVVAAAAIVLLGTAFGSTNADNPGARVLARFALSTAAIYVGGLALIPFTFAVKIWHYYPFRVGQAMVPLVGLLLAWRVASVWAMRPQTRLRVGAFLVTCFTVAALVGLTHDLQVRLDHPAGRTTYRGDKGLAQEEACAWIRENTPRGSVILSSPRLDSVGYLAERPLVVRFRCVPSGRADLHEWWTRILALNGGTAPVSVGYRAADELDTGFRRLSTSAYTELGHRYGASYVLVRSRSSIRLEKVFANEYWDVYAIPEE